jgi:predicted phosphodiesterase
MRIALIADTHLSSRLPECVANWHAARRAVKRIGADLTVHLGDITLDGQSRRDELVFASRLMQHWPTELKCVPGNHDLGDGSGEMPLDERLLIAYGDAVGPDRWVGKAGHWRLPGINAQLLGTRTPQEDALWTWIAEQLGPSSDCEHSALFLHRPLLRSGTGEVTRRGQYVSSAEAERLLNGPLKPTLRVVVSGHTHQYRDVMVDDVRHLWMPSTAFILPDEMQVRIGEKLAGIGLLDLGESAARFALWCPNGMTCHDVSELQFLRAIAGTAVVADTHVATM